MHLCSETISHRSLDNHLNQASARKSDLHAGTDRSGTGGHPRIPDGIELIHLLQICNKDEHLQQGSAIRGQTLQRLVHLLQHLAGLILEVGRAIFGHFHPASDSAMDHHVRPA